MDVRRSARSAVTAMLASASGLDEDPGTAETMEWKVLILDESCREVLGPLFSVNELRKKGVTTHFALEENREAIEDACGVYLCRPTEGNAERIANDVGSKLYGRFHVNFCSHTERRVLEKMAKDLALCLAPDDPVPRLPVWDRSLDFVALEPRLFSLCGPSDSLQLCAAFARQQTAPPPTDDDRIDRIAGALACAVETCFTTEGDDVEWIPPLLRARPGTASARVAEVLKRKLSDAAKRIDHQRTSSSKKKIPAGGFGQPIVQTSGGPPTAQSNEGKRFRRPLVVLLDRMDDVATPLRHTESYQALVDDVLDLAKNRTKVDGVTYDLAVDGDDEFFAVHARRSLPDVIDASSADLAELRDAEQRVRGRTAGESKSLVDAVGELPALLEKKKRLEAHTTVLQAIMTKIAERDLPTYYDAEERKADHRFLTDLLGKDAKGSLQDKLRLLFVKALGGTGSSSVVVSDDDMTAFHAVLKEAHPGDPLVDDGMTALAEAKNLLSSRPSNTTTTTTTEETIEVPSFAKLLSQGARVTTKLVDKAAQGVGGLLLAGKSGFACKVLDDLLSSKGTFHDAFLTFDPTTKSSHAGVGTSDVIVFVVGGGSYAEYHALHAAFGDSANLVYGATHLINPNAFLTDLINVVRLPDDNNGVKTTVESSS